MRLVEIVDADDLAPSSFGRGELLGLRGVQYAGREGGADRILMRGGLEFAALECLVQLLLQRLGGSQRIEGIAQRTESLVGIVRASDAVE